MVKDWARIIFFGLFIGDGLASLDDRIRLPDDRDIGMTGMKPSLSAVADLRRSLVERRVWLLRDDDDEED